MKRSGGKLRPPYYGDDVKKQYDLLNDKTTAYRYMLREVEQQPDKRLNNPIKP
jgi:hypothetical protein